MNEGIPNMESGAERLPSKEEIRSIFGQLLNGKEYKELKYREDEKGVSVYEIEATNERGYRVEYNYQRAKYDHKTTTVAPGARFTASIHVTEFDRDGMPVGGDNVANYKDGEWTRVMDK